MFTQATIPVQSSADDNVGMVCQHCAPYFHGADTEDVRFLWGDDYANRINAFIDRVGLVSLRHIILSGFICDCCGGESCGDAYPLIRFP